VVLIFYFGLYNLQSHHQPRDGAFELNDVFAIINAGPAIALLAYGLSTKGLFPGLCFGAVSTWSFNFCFCFVFPSQNPKFGVGFVFLQIYTHQTCPYFFHLVINVGCESTNITLSHFFLYIFFWV
jgi:hypothetical protein